MSKLTYELLRVLVEQSPDVASNDELANRIWGSRRVVTPENLAKRVMLLRQALGDNAEQPRYIERVRCPGYRLIPEVEEVQPQDETGAATAATRDSGAAPRFARRSPRIWSKGSGLGASALLLVVVAGWLAFDRSQSHDPSATARSIAVLPFENLSLTEEDAGFFAQGIHDDLITRLATIEDLKVTPRASVMDYRSQLRSRRRVGEELGVEVVLDGSVQRAGNKVRVNVQLIDARTDETVWGESYDQELTAENVFAIQKDIVTAIAQELEAKLTPEAATRLSQAPTQNMRALDLYMSGRDYERPPFAYWELAALQYQRAVEEDPQFALAHARLSLASLLAFYNSDGDRARVEVAKAAAEEAIRLQPDLALGHVALAFYLVMQTTELERAFAELATAAPQAQSEAQFFVVRALVNERLGKREEALADRAEALALSPRHPARMLDVAIWQARAGEYDEAQRLIDRALDIRPDFMSAVMFNAELALFRDGDGALLKKLSAEDFANDPARKARLKELQWLAAICERDYEAAVRMLESERVTAAERTPREHAASILSMASTLRLAGELDKAREQCAEGLRLSQHDKPEWRRWRAAFLAACGQAEGGLDLGRQLLAEIQPHDPSGNLLRLWLPREVLMPAGARAVAIEELDEYLSEPGSWSVEGLLPDPRFDAIRDEPSFQAAVAKHARR